MKIGVLAIQGGFIEHENHIKSLGAEVFEIRKKSDLFSPFDGLILPGGESTVIGKLLIELDMMGDLRELIKSGLPVFGTCAGLILLAKKIDDGEKSHIAVMDICAKRNAYGRQLGSFMANGVFNGIEIPLTFIRAPYISEVSDEVEILCTVDGKIVAARENNMLAAAFHPELTNSTYVHQYFLDMCNEARK